MQSRGCSVRAFPTRGHAKKQTGRYDVKHRFIGRIGVLTIAVTVAWLTATQVGGQAPGANQGAQAARWTPPKTSWGDPDFQGIWDSRSGVPLERPAEFGNREFMTEQEAVDRRKRGLDNAASGEDDDG